MPTLPDDFAQLTRVLNLLRQGRPVRGKHFGLIRTSSDPSREQLFRRIVSATMTGPQDNSHSTWLKGNYGGGKTQALFHLEEQLSDRAFGEFKVLACIVDLNHGPSATAPGLHKALFESASALMSPNQKSIVSNFSEYIKSSKSDPSKGAENILALGLDLATTVLTFHVPGAGIAAKGGLSWVKRKWASRRSSIKRHIEAKHIDDPRAIELLIRWLQYTLSPDEARWRSLDDYIQSLADKRGLFPALMRILRATGYATVIIMVDQAEKLVGNVSLTDEFARIHSSESNAGLNLFFVFAGTTDVARITTGDHGGFVRRFMDPTQSSTVDVALDRPTIDVSLGNDIDRVKGMFQDLRKQYLGAPIPNLDADGVARARSYLQDLATRGEVTWPMFWRPVLGGLELTGSLQP